MSIYWYRLISLTRTGLKKDINLLFFSLLCIFFAGCALNSTRSLPYTKLENINFEHHTLNKNTQIITDKFITDNIPIEVTHYEGILQAEQPTNFGGPSKEVKDKIAVLAIHHAKEGFFSEFTKAGFKVSPNLDTSLEQKCFYQLNGRISKIIVKTYGVGMGGWGSAGNYWESYVYLSDTGIYDSCTNSNYNVGQIDGYAKVKESPVQLSGGFLGGLVLAIRISKNPLNGLNPDYDLNDFDDSPISLASRIAAQNFLKKLK